MLIDHIGGVFFPDTPEFRYIGRIAMPIFVYGLAVGARRTVNIRKYFFRLLLLAVVSQPVYELVFLTSRLNILFELSFGLVFIYLLQEKRYMQFGFMVCFAVLLQFWIGLEYAGLSAILCFVYYFSTGRVSDYLLLLFCFLIFGMTHVFVLSQAYLILTQFIVCSCLLAIFYSTVSFFKPVSNFLQKASSFPRRLGYIFYPLHLLGIVLLKKVYF